MGKKCIFFHSSRHFRKLKLCMVNSSDKSKVFWKNDFHVGGVSLCRHMSQSTTVWIRLIWVSKWFNCEKHVKMSHCLFPSKPYLTKEMEINMMHSKKPINCFKFRKLCSTTSQTKKNHYVLHTAHIKRKIHTKGRRWS